MDSAPVCKERVNLPHAFKYRLGCLHSRLVQLITPEVISLPQNTWHTKSTILDLSNFQHVNTAKQEDNAYYT